jgi:hypothetical protein
MIVRIGCIVALLATGVFAQSAQPDTTLRGVLARAATELEAYQAAMAFVLATESAEQEVRNAAGRRLATRQTTGDFFLAYLPDDGRWFAVRDITAVDGEPVPQRDDVAALLRQGASARIGRVIADRNARYNIGGITRNFNDPMFALVILSAKNQSRFRFSRDKITTTADATLVTISFTERDRPTLVQAADGSPVFTRGELVIDAGTGRLQQSIISMRAGPTTAQLTTTFTRNEKLDLWLPATMSERYEHSTSARTEVVTVESAYTDYRKFETSVRIK